MIKVFKWWWAWDYEKIEDWLEKMEAGGLRLIHTEWNGLYFYFEKCTPKKARYCIDYQSRLTPEYMTIIYDDNWKLYQIGMGWYILRKEYEAERPNLYNDFSSLIARNRTLLIIAGAATLIEILSVGSMIYDTLAYPSNNKIATTCILGSVVIAFFAFIITNLALQISKFSKKV